MSTALYALDRLIAIHEVTFAPLSPQQAEVQTRFTLRREDIATLRQIRRSIDQATEGR